MVPPDDRPKTREQQRCSPPDPSDDPILRRDPTHPSLIREARRRAGLGRARPRPRASRLAESLRAEPDENGAVRSRTDARQASSPHRGADCGDVAPARTVKRKAARLQDRGLEVRVLSPLLGKACKIDSLRRARPTELAARTLAVPDARSVEDLTELLTSAGSALRSRVTAPGLRRSGGSPAASAPRGPAPARRGPRPRPRTGGFRSRAARVRARS